jgi:hypothetical protein
LQIWWRKEIEVEVEEWGKHPIFIEDSTKTTIRTHETKVILANQT